MPSIHRFVVVPAVPEKLKALTELANNLWTLWNYDASGLFRRLDPELWESTKHNPVRVLSLISQEKLASAAADEGFLAHMNRILADLRHYMTTTTWYTQNYAPAAGANPTKIAYFSAEYGLHESLPIYSGGLGILSGDHMKSASDLGLPLVGVGLLYRFGYFRQSLNADGWQQEAYPENDFFHLPLTQVMDSDKRPVTIELEYPDSKVKAYIWKVQVGRISLYLLDANVPSNRPEDREITARLYGGDQDMRVRQEVLLGIGGMRALTAMGYKPTVCHMNEGHSAFLSVERIRVLMEEEKLTFKQALELVASSNVFTTHTPVPAGNDAFPLDTIERYLGPYYTKLGLTKEQFFDLGKINAGDTHEPFGMTVLALRTAWHCNGVSALHGEVSRKMWQRIWPDVPMPEIPINSITNGVHTQTWLSDEFSNLYTRYLGVNWSDKPTNYAMWDRIDRVPDSELWRSHERRREHLVNFVRDRLHAQFERRGSTAAEKSRIEEILDPEALTIGFARRFATYKRATLLFRNKERLIKLLANRDRPLQFVFAGKSHPRDDGGKRFIQDIIAFCKREDVRNRMVFIEDYDMNVARYLVQGVDVWLNTPRRPMEASGTSGMKGPINGAINLSILDGWWVECFKNNPQSGWAIGTEAEYNNDEFQDHVDSESLFDLIEKEVIPEFYERGADGLPRKWIHRMKQSIHSVCSYFNTSRQVQEYFEKFYLPAHNTCIALVGQHAAGAKALAEWKDHISKEWGKVWIFDVKSNDTDQLQAGSTLDVQASVSLGPIKPEEVNVELYYGSIDAAGNISNAHNIPMTKIATEEKKAPEYPIHTYAGKIVAQSCGLQGFAVRALPKNANVALRMEPGLIRWN
ncbi:MAG TPA: alpha-glucan family phosphorylase [Phycisphaerae bacterium]|nr:alpha-glucan family phosphorylase [Phycisphaerae bacterium]